MRASVAADQGLTDDGLHEIGPEWLGDQEDRLLSFAGEQGFRIGSDEDDRAVPGLADLIDRVDARGTVGEAYIG